MSITKLNNGKFKVYVTAKGHPKYRKTVSTKPEAIILEATLRKEILDNSTPETIKTYLKNLNPNKYHIKEHTQELDSIPWDKLQELGVRHYRGTKDERNGISRVNEVIERLRVITPLRDLKESHIDDLVNYWKSKDLNNKTINKKLSVLSVLLTIAQRKELIHRKPSIQRLKEGKGRLWWFTDDQLEAFFKEIRNDEAYKDLEIVYLFLLDTGCRVSELMRFNKLKVDITDSVTFRGTKSDETRTIPLTDRLREHMEKQKGDYPFPDLTYVRLRKSFDKVKSKLGWPDYYVRHTFRHTCATRLAQRGVHIVTIKNWMGHSNIATTMLYIQFSPDYLQEGLSALNNV